MKKQTTLAATLATAVLLTSSFATAAPVQLDVSGTVSSATGVWSGDTGSAFSGTVVIDLDSNNAAGFEIISPSGEPPFPRWVFTGPPYQTSFSGSIGGLTQQRAIVETIDNFDADANGNPFGATGIIDILSVYGSSVVVDCTGGTMNSITGCSLPDAPEVSGEEFELILVDTSDWFSGNVLPSSIPAYGDLVAVVGIGQSWGGSAVTADAQFAYSSLAVGSPSVPVLGPVGVALMGGLLGLLGIRRLRG
jgi:hypothetical protein